ncbi:hypothetical protein B7463_g2045, partial [Scytalidium lignicola]
MSRAEDSEESSSSYSRTPSPKPIVVPNNRRHMALRRLEGDVRSSGPRLRKNDYNRLNIRVTPVTLDENGAPCPEFCFFSPYQGDDLPPVNKETMGRDFREYGEDDDHGKFGLDTIERTRVMQVYFMIYWNSYIFNLRDKGEAVWSAKDPQYAVRNITDDPDQQSPHLMCQMIHDMNADGRLFRSELLIIIILIRSRIEFGEFDQYKVAPVLLYSFFGLQHARILHAYYDNDSHELIVARSQTFNFQLQNIPALQLFARWSLSHRVGNTKHEVYGMFPPTGIPIRTERIESARKRQRSEVDILFERRASAERHAAAARNASTERRAAAERHVEAERRASAERHSAALMLARAELTEAIIGRESRESVKAAESAKAAETDTNPE